MNASTGRGRVRQRLGNLALLCLLAGGPGFDPRVTLEQGSSGLIEWANTTADVAEDFCDRALRELQDKGLLVQGTAIP